MVITVLMAVYDTSCRMLRQAVDSILAQTHSQFEFLIVDDGSRDPVLIEYLRRIASCESRIRVIRAPHQGLTRSLNLGLKLARGAWIARQDADDWSDPARLERQLQFLATCPGVSLCGSNAWTHQHSGRPLWPTDLPQTHSRILAAFPEGNPFVHGAVMFSRRQALAIGGYREEFRSSQDYDFFWRLAETGVAANLQDCLYHYRYTAGSISAARATEQIIAYRAAQELARVRAAQISKHPHKSKVEMSMDVDAALERAEREIHESPRNLLRSRLKQADHMLLAGDYEAALSVYLHLLRGGPVSVLTWAKLARFALFRAFPPIREVCFR